MSFSYVLREGFAGFRRARLSSISSIVAIMLAVLLLGMLARVSFNAFELAQALKQEVEVEVFLQDVDQSRTNSLRSSLEEYEIVETVTYVSKEEAMEEFRREFGPESELLGNVNFLPAKFTVRTTPDAAAAEIVGMVESIRDWRGVDEVVFNQAGLELLEERLNMLIIAGGALTLFIMLTAMVLVFNTIRLTIYAKKNLIKAMKLVGATNNFIKRPFLVEGVLQGLIAGLLASGLVWLIFNYLIPVYLPIAGVLSWPFGRWFYLVGAMLILGIFMGLMGSRWAAKKFIKETSIA